MRLAASPASLITCRSQLAVTVYKHGKNLLRKITSSSFLAEVNLALEFVLSLPRNFIKVSSAVYPLT